MARINEILTKKNECNTLQTSQNGQAWLSIKRNEILAKYPTFEDFAKVFNPSLQFKVAENVEYSIKANTPTIRQLKATYSIDQLKLWLSAQLENLNQYTGVKSKMSGEQMEMLAEVMLTNNQYLKSAEILLFFHKLKSGHFGKFYGNVDPMEIVSFMNDFLKWRSGEIDKIKQREAEAKRAEMYKIKPRDISKYIAVESLGK